MTDAQTNLVILFSLIMIALDSLIDLIHTDKHVPPEKTVGPLKDTLPPINGLLVFSIIPLSGLLGFIVIKTFPTWSHFLSL